MNQVVAKVETITPEIAKEYLKANVGNRPLNERTVDYYADQMKKGQWKLNGEAICFSSGGKLENGQHRLVAIVKSGIPIDILVVRNVEYGSFTTYDTGRKRSFGDVFSLAEISDSNNAAALINKYIQLKQGMVLTKGSLSCVARKITSSDALLEYNKHPQMFIQCLQLAKSCYSKIRLMTQSEIGGIAAFLVLEKGHSFEFVKGFFEALFFDKNRNLNVIENLRNKLITSKMSHVKLTNSYKTAIIKKTWNCYVLGKDLKALSYNQERESTPEFL